MSFVPMVAVMIKRKSRCHPLFLCRGASSSVVERGRAGLNQLKRVDLAEPFSYTVADATRSGSLTSSSKIAQVIGKERREI